VNICYVTAIFPFGAYETFFRPEVRTLAKTDDVLLVATRPRQLEVEYPDLRTRAAHVDNYGRETLSAAWRELRRHPRAVLAALAAVLLPRYRPAAKLKNLMLFPKALALAQIVRHERIDHIHAQWITTPATIAMIASRLTGVPFSITAHQHDIFSDNLLTGKVRSAAFTRVISTRNCRHLQEFVAADAAPRCTVIHLGVDVPPTIAEPPQRAVPRLICAARFGVWKGHTVLIDALVILRARGLEFVCDFAGDGELRDTVVAALEKSALGEQVKLLGNVDHAVLTASLASGDYDIFVLASTEVPGEHEGIPIAIMEAMAAGLPIVSTTTGSIDELVIPATGSLVPQRDPVALADALDPLLRNAALRRTMGARAREHVQAHFSTEATTAQLRERIAGATPTGANPRS
jgi:glycosyltransferase involved in cell wall biosynthesis